jgi:uncharacterized membrane protein
MQNDPSDKENYNDQNNAPSGTAPSVGKPSENMDGKSSMGLQPNIAAALSYALIYIVGIVSSLVIILVFVQDVPTNRSGDIPAWAIREIETKILINTFISLIVSAVITLGAGLIFFVMEKENRFVRLHAMQAILFGVLWFAVPILLGIMTMALGAGVAVLSILVSIAFLVGWILLIVKAYKGEILKLPVISDLAENIVTK